MANILLIETALETCGAALAQGQDIISIRQEQGPNLHSRLLTGFIQAVLEEAQLQPHGVDAVAVSAGPGSYTGLRIGVAAAKGFCFAIQAPLIGCDTLRAMMENVKNHVESPYPLFCPMIDARRMEVWTGVYDDSGKVVLPPRAAILEEDFFSLLPQDEQIIFCGSGMPKARPLLMERLPHAVFLEDIGPDVRCLLPEALEKWAKKDFENVLNFEPFYLKEVHTTTPKG